MGRCGCAEAHSSFIEASYLYIYILFSFIVFCSLLLRSAGMHCHLGDSFGTCAQVKKSIIEIFPRVQMAIGKYLESRYQMSPTIIIIILLANSRTGSATA